MAEGKEQGERARHRMEDVWAVKRKVSEKVVKGTSESLEASVLEVIGVRVCKTAVTPWSTRS